MTEEKKNKRKHYSFNMQFESEDSRKEFKDYLENRKAKGTPFYQTAKEMMEFHKEHFKR